MGKKGSWNIFGFLRPEVVCALKDVRQRIYQSWDERSSYYYAPESLRASLGDSRPNYILESVAGYFRRSGEGYRFDALEDLGYRDGAASGVAAPLLETYNRLRQVVRYFRDVPPPESLLDVPVDIHPDRHGRLKDGMLARLVGEDLTTQIGAGRVLVESLAAEPTVRDWELKTAAVLAGLSPTVGEGFRRVTSGMDACGGPLIAEAGALSRAYLALGLAYLEEVQERMPDYAEASGQALSVPPVSLIFSGGIYYGGQFAGQIANIDSTIAGIVQHGNPDVANALKALEQAVLSQEGLDEDQRGDLLDNVGYLAEAAQTPPEKRNRGIIKSVLAALTTAATSGVECRTGLRGNVMPAAA